MQRFIKHSIIVLFGFAGIQSTVLAQPGSELKKEEVEAQKEKIQASSMEEAEKDLHFQSEAQPVSTISKNKRSKSFYSKQSDNWEGVVTTQPNSAEAWSNYYKSSRYGLFSSSSKDITATEQQELDAIVQSMEESIPNTYEFHYIKYLNGNYNTELFPHLEQAYKLRPGSSELYDDFIAHYEIENNTTKKKEFCQKLQKSNEIPEGISNYNYNVLMSLEQNAILITNGEYDTYPAWVIQEVEGTRKDVTILNLDLLENEGYKKRKLQELKLTSFQQVKNNQKAFLKELTSKNPNRPIYFGLTVSKDIIKTVQANLFVTGLALKYSKSSFNNMELLSNNWENNFKKDYLYNTKYHDVTVRKLNNNYILPVLMLHKYYQERGNTAKATETKSLAEKLAKEGNKQTIVKDYLDK